MTRTFRYRLRPNAAGQARLLTVLNLCRDLYNAALQERRDAWKKAGKSIGFAAQCRGDTIVRAENPEYAALPRRLTTNVLRHLDRAFAAFFRRIKAGEVAGYPRFKGRDRYNSFGWDAGPGTGWALEGKHLRIGTGNNEIRFRVSFHRPLPEGAVVKGFRVKREGRHWYVNLVLDLGTAPEKTPVRNMVGIDLGVTTFATLTNAPPIENPRFLKQSLGKLADAQRLVALKPRRKSHRRDKAKAAVARLHLKVRNQRREFLHEESRKLVNKYDLIIHEDLNIRGMTRRGEVTPAAIVGLHRSIADASWGQFIGMLTYKAECAGTWVIPVDPRNTSQICSRCRTTVRKKLSERVHTCPHCELVLGRDDNAARVVLDRGMRSARDMKVPFAESVLGSLTAAPECR